MPSATSHTVLQRAQELEQSGFRRGAIDVLEAELAQAPDAGALWEQRAIYLQRDGRAAEAFEDIQRALVLAPLGVEGWLVLGEGYRREGRCFAAASVFLDLAGRELTAETWQAVHDGLAGLGRWSAALAVCRRAARERPDDDAVYFAMAHALARLGRPPELSINVLRKAISLNPAEPRYRASLAIQLLRLDRRDDAYEVVAAMSPEMLQGMTCRCCLQKVLQLCITSGDAPRSAALAGQLARVSAAATSRKEAPQ
jgi:tetratricopeptide (TPR) repeat protein